MSNSRTQTATTAPTGLAALIPTQSWIIGAKEDFVLFLGTPLLLIALFAVAERYWSLTAVTVFATVLAMGHYLPGFLRAYGDPALFRRFRVRFVVAPVVLITAALVFSQYELDAYLMAVVMWGAWHWLMQTYGLVRIYDAKARNFDAASARLDYALCIAWFGVLYWRTDGAAGVFMHFYKAGGLLSPIVVQWIARGWVLATVAITAFYLGHVVRRTRAGHPPSLLKLALLGVSYLFYLYAFGYSSSKLVAFALFEGYHDIQYLAIVWVFNRNRAAKDAAAGAFTRFLFRQRAPLIVLYVLLCVGFGSYDYFARTIDEGALAKLALGLITGLAMVHFYFDGFIWRIREPETRQTLDVAGDGSATTEERRLPSYVRHGLIWAALGIPVLLLGVWEISGRAADDSAVYQTVLRVRPSSHKSHYMLGRSLEDAEQYEEALERLGRARELRPGYDLYDMRYADLLLARGSLSEAELDEVISCYENGVITWPGLVNLHRNWAKALRLRGRLDEAAERYPYALLLDPTHAETHYDFATVLMMQQNFDGAGQFCAEAVRLDPDYVDAHGLLGMIRTAQGRPKEGFDHYRQALRVEPDRVRILTSLALGLANVEDPALRDPDEAVQLADKARGLVGENPGVWESLAAVYAAAGRFDGATSAAEEAARLYRAAGQEALAAQVVARIEHFRKEHP